MKSAVFDQSILFLLWSMVWIISHILIFFVLTGRDELENKMFEYIKNSKYWIISAFNYSDLKIWNLGLYYNSFVGYTPTEQINQFHD